MRRGPVAILALALSGAGLSAGPSRFGFSDRIERHLFPEVTTGPDHPTWSPDGAWIAFAMQGDIWKIPAKGGDAVALTHGPAYYFEPQWSPDGRSIALTMDTDGNLDVGVVSADGGAVTRLTDAREVDLEPAWSRDNQDLYFVSARGGRGFDIYKVRVADRSVAPVVTDPGDQVQPAVSPDGTTLAYVSPVPGKLGTGGIWTRPLAGGAPALVHYEETEYRVRPEWTPDGKSLLYDSDEMGSNDVAIVPAAGGNPFVLTNDPMGEFAPAVSSDGAWLAFVSNRTGPLTLEVAPIGGGPVSAWRDVAVARRRAAVPTGRVHGLVTAAAGPAMPARIEVTAGDGRSYAPDGGFARVIAVSETHYFHATGAFDLEVPAGLLTITALRGFEYAPATAKVDVKPGVTANVALTMRRMFDAPAFGWYGGDTHAHDLHQGRFGLTHRTLFDQSLAEDLHVTNVLIHMDGTRIMGRWGDLTGKPDPLSTPTHMMQFAEEFRGSLGHIGMIGIRKYVLPLVGGENDTAYAEVASDVPYLDGARAQGGLAGYMHPYTRASQNPAAPNPAAWDGSLIPVDVALGKGDFYDVASLYSDELGSAEMYYRLLNCGFRLAATGGTDNFPDVWRDPPPGTDRTYVRIPGTFSLASWFAGIKAGHTFATTGPLVFLTVAGRGPGDELRLADTASTDLAVSVSVSSIVPVDKLELIVNGSVSPPISLATTKEYHGRVSVPAGGWVAARVLGPPSTHVADSYAFAQTSPVYVVRGKTPFVSKSDAAFLAAVVDAIWARANRSPWRSDANRDAFKAQIDQAKSVYVKLAGGGLP
ncbi:MAG TPA: CehA/McbA family metallohydrolase [Vicinamibacterales bacterium]|nr:CehA/McbA family metallohydrolase [Vicinamibacterales bacterium]